MRQWKSGGQWKSENLSRTKQWEEEREFQESSKVIRSQMMEGTVVPDPIAACIASFVLGNVLHINR